nr:translation initiation factor IF-2-like [Aegilops tauschii subsp. strangulata]
MTKQKPPPHHWSHRPETQAGQTSHLDDVFKKSAAPEGVGVAGPGQKPEAELSPGAATLSAEPKPGRTTKQPLAATKQPDPENPGPARASHARPELPPPAIRRIHSARSCRSTTKTPPRPPTAGAAPERDHHRAASPHRPPEPHPPASEPRPRARPSLPRPAASQRDAPPPPSLEPVRASPAVSSGGGEIVCNSTNFVCNFSEW